MNRICVIEQHGNKTGQVRDAIKYRRLHCYPTKKMKEKEIVLVMKNRCRMNEIAILTVLDLLFYYHLTRFEIIPLVFPDHHLDIFSEL